MGNPRDRRREEIDEPLADGEMFEALDDHLEEDIEPDDLDPDDPWEYEQKIRLQKRAQNINNIWQ